MFPYGNLKVRRKEYIDSLIITSQTDWLVNSLVI